MVKEPKKKKRKPANAKGFNTADSEPRSITIAQAAYVTRNIRDKCNDLYHQTSGEVMDIISGLVVVISEAIFSETDPVNDNIL